MIKSRKYANLESGAIIGKYQIVSLLGKGSMNNVYLCFDTDSGRKVAIKILPNSLAYDTVRVGRFKREAKMLEALEHPNIGSFYEIFETDDRHYLVLEYVDGQHLDDYAVAVECALQPLLKVFLQLARALLDVHAADIVHRDIKPSNVLVKEKGQLVVIDFGIGKFTNSNGDSGISATGDLIGTPKYMSPEQVLGLEVGARTDLWSFGLTLYYCLTGRVPFDEGEDIHEYMFNLVNHPPKMECLSEDLPIAIRELIGKCLNQDYSTRIVTAEDAVRVMEDALV